MHRTAFGQIGDGLGHVEEAGDATRRRGIDHDGVVDRPLVLVDADHGFLDLAGEQHVAQTGRDRRGELDRADAPHRTPGDPEVVEHVEVLQERCLDADRECSDLAAALGGGDLLLLVRQGRNVEELCNALALFDFHQQDLAAAGGQRERQRGRNCGFAGAALAADEVQASLRQAGGPADGMPVVCGGRHAVHASQQSPG